MYDVIIIGAGVVGASIARELARYRLKVAVLEKGSDVAVGPSRANSGIVHGGYSDKPGTLKAKFSVAGQKMFDQVADELQFPFNRCGSLVVAFDETGRETLERLKQQGEENGLEGLRILGGDEVKKLEPQLADTVCAALHVPMGGITSPYKMTIAYAENAADNGVDFLFHHEVEAISRNVDNSFSVGVKGLEAATFKARMVINAAGLASDDIFNLLSEQKIKIKPRLGEYLLLDTTEHGLVNRTIFQLPTKMGKGVLVTPTVDQNILLGPTTVDVFEKDQALTTAEGLENIMKTAALSVKNLNKQKIITAFSGLRAHLDIDDFIIEEATDVPGFINVCGIASPGLTAAPAIAKQVEAWVALRLNPAPNEDFQPRREQPPLFRKLSHEAQHDLIAKDPAYGEIICRCEMVTKGEIKAALRSPLQVRHVDGIKMRTRLGMGRCQGGFCHMKVLDVLAEELNIPLTEVTKSGKDTNFLIKANKKDL